MEEIIKTFGIKWELLTFQAVNFAILLVLLHRFLYQPLLNAIEERETHIRKGIEDADNARKELEHARDEKRHILTKAAEEAETTLAAAKKSANEERTAALRETAERSAALLARAEKQGEDTKRRLIIESKEEIARIAILATERILRKS